MAQHRQRALLVQRLAQALQHHGLGRRAVQLAQLRPRLGLRRLQPGQHIGRVQRARRVPAACIALGARLRILPAVRGQVLADVALELDFGVQGHGLGLMNQIGL